MRKHILILMLVLPLLLMSCVENNKPTEEVTSESEDKATNAPGVNDDIQGIDGYSSLDLIQYSREYTPYEAGSGYYFSGTFLESTVTEKLIEYEYNECRFLIYRDPSGNIMVAGSKENYGTDIILQIADDAYAYPADNIKIEGFKNVLGHDGVIISFTEGADSRPIIYLSCDGDGWIYPLAMCNKSNYEVDVNGDGVNDLISWRNSQIHVVYMSDGELYTVEIMEILNAEVLNKELNIHAIGCFYDNDTNTFEAGGYKDEEYIAVTAFIKNNILYYNTTDGGLTEEYDWAVGFIQDFINAVETTDYREIEKYIVSPMEVVSDGDYIFIDTGKKSGDVAVQYSLYALDGSEYSLRLTAREAESLSKILLIFEGYRYRPDDTDGSILFYNVRIERKDNECIIISYENDI